MLLPDGFRVTEKKGNNSHTMVVLKSAVTGHCPGGFCNYIKDNSEFVIVLLCVEAFIFLVTLIPPLFNWSRKKPDGRKRIYFGALACITFYFWLIFLAVNTLYCFGFVVQSGPCLNSTSSVVVVNKTPAQLDQPKSTSQTTSQSTKGRPYFCAIFCGNVV